MRGPSAIYVTVPGLAVALALAAGCPADEQIACMPGTCTDPGRPYCDVDGTVAGTPGVCLAVSCAPGSFAACRGDDEAIVCNASGNDYETKTCADGCDSASGGCHDCNADRCVPGGLSRCLDRKLEPPTACTAYCLDAPVAHCAVLEPKYLPDVCDQMTMQGALDLAANTTLHTGSVSLCTGGVVAQTAAPDMCVARHSTITIRTGVVVTVSGGAPPGGGGRSLALVADGDVIIDGTLDLAATGARSGPGGSEVPAAFTPSPAIAEGGAGYKTDGGHGGNMTTDGGAMNGTGATTNPLLLTGLAGGARAGGGGGGAITIISCRGTVKVNGTIDVGGGGGPSVDSVARAGGSGGTVSIQGLRVEIRGQLFANGGGGAAGLATGQSPPAAAGEDGSRSFTTSAAGGAAMVGGGNGGHGGRQGVAPGPGLRPTAGRPGAGGGSTGFLQTYTPAGIDAVLLPTIASPSLEPNAVVRTR